MKNNQLRAYIRRTVEKMNLLPRQKEEVYDEWMDHLQNTAEELRQHGWTNEGAEKEAIRQFGDQHELIPIMEKALTPLPVQWLWPLASSLLLYSFAVFVPTAFAHDQAGIVLFILLNIAAGWIGTCGKRAVLGHNKVIVSASLLFMLLLVSMAHSLSLPQEIVALTWIVQLTLVVFIYLHVLREPKDKKVLVSRKQRYAIHGIQLTIGGVVFYHGLLLSFFGLFWLGSIWPIVTFGGGLIFLWGLLYWIQWKALAHHPKVAWSLCGLSMLVVTSYSLLLLI
ncbi:hypothetical protein G4V62_02565 [Bacillaceae bacterium SIJ1]|uniref:permease prefix domain 1-containing protein n=1 Tax=Litoribacterium kuwaitense TaxID=1398745 RepID=UPI0013EBDA35|nr:permease prefix domain 1-containing protein [Litoribacterium kuwaitense]NGP43883.1 hypothetical protein [Litoribacterium kuwaitense]